MCGPVLSGGETAENSSLASACSSALLKAAAWHLSKMSFIAEPIGGEHRNRAVPVGERHLDLP
jgi:hypothetical protein